MPCNIDRPRTSKPNQTKANKYFKLSSYFWNTGIFLGKTETTEIVLSHEHLDFIWLVFDNALNKTTYENAKNLLKKSKVFLDKRIVN